MKCGLRFKALTGALLFIGLVVILLVLEDKCETYDPVGYVQASIPWFQDYRPPHSGPVGGEIADKILVVPALEEDDVSWVTDELKDWQHAIYTVNPSANSTQARKLVTPVNKGHEAMAYLTYIIDHYNTTLPSVIAFLHSHRNGFFQAWHVDTPLHDNVYAMRHLQTSYVEEMGYVNLRCNVNPGCKNPQRSNPHITGDVWLEVMGNTSTPAFNQHKYRPAAQEVFSRAEDKEKLQFMHPVIWTPCCAQFAVSSRMIYKRPLEDYVKIRQWVIETSKDDAQSGRTMEYLWHVIFGQEAVHCPDAETCYCKVYGRC
ncbi:hypothetical protein LTR05_006835 [Lithohypha guttulata]|uniref:Uncharacterized protein n=1 Tax=Lithohypha guttulata TaxID=1690604 RepID=A0AAN7SX18_9EURO|nr:hypothetical protein LTR05_006835 [Lithohypha guttulata]